MSQLDTCGAPPSPLVYYNPNRARQSSATPNPLSLSTPFCTVAYPPPPAPPLPDQMGSSSDPLINLSLVQSRMDSLHKLLSNSVNSGTLLGQPQMNMISSEINSAIRKIIVNGAALLSGPQFFPAHNQMKEEVPENPNPIKDPKAQIHADDVSDDFEIVELDAVELLAEYVHFCEICGKGFKRDANLRMHMRAHGNQFKTPEALSKPAEIKDGVQLSTPRRMRFSCPYVGCNRNKQHKKFRPLKSVICVKNHFKRSHCPKVYSCNRCNKKSFSVVADLKSHLKHCGDRKWRCSCGTSFSRKDKLFGHILLFEGHMPAADEDEQEINVKNVAASFADDDDELKDDELKDDDGVFDGILLDELEPIDDFCFQDLLNSPNSLNTIGSGIDGFFNF